MGKFNNLMITAAEALRAVEQRVSTLDIGLLDGWVEEVHSTGDGFLVKYIVTTDEGDEAHRYAVDEDNFVSVLDLAEYDLGTKDSYDMTMDIPQLMEMVNEDTLG